MDLPVCKLWDVIMSPVNRTSSLGRFEPQINWSWKTFTLANLKEDLCALRRFHKSGNKLPDLTGGRKWDKRMCGGGAVKYMFNKEPKYLKIFTFSYELLPIEMCAFAVMPRRRPMEVRKWLYPEGWARADNTTLTRVLGLYLNNKENVDWRKLQNGDYSPNIVIVEIKFATKFNQNCIQNGLEYRPIKQ